MLIEVSRLTDVNIVTATGVYTYDALPPFFKFRPPPEDSTKCRDVLTEMFLHDINVGVQGTGVRAAIIKCATDRAGMTPNIVRILTACARAHRETGAPIVTHTYAASRCGLDQQRLFKAEGVDLRRVVIGHSGDSDDFDYLRRLLDAGSFIGADRFGLEMNGLPNVEQRCRIVAHLVAEGYEDQILLSHDSSVFTDWWPEEYGQDQTWRQEWNLELIPRTVVPTLLALGVSARAVDKMLVDNPRSLLESNQPY
jgi:phosphotriesterase-related protein